MMYRWLTLLFACTTAIFGAILIWPLLPRAAQGAPSDEDIVFSYKTFVSTQAYVAAKGTLSGDWIAYKNNAYSILCIPTECIVADLEQIGANQVSDIDGPVVYPIKHWTPDAEVVAEDDALCARITITLDRKTKNVLWVETPINQSEPSCKNVDNNIRKATLEASPYWRRLEHK
jgi:hypothetical protein